MDQGEQQHPKQPLGGTAHRQHRQEAPAWPCFFVCQCLNAGACVLANDPLQKAAHLELVSVKYNLTDEI